jgi:hypothetical protein
VALGGQDVENLKKRLNDAYAAISELERKKRTALEVAEQIKATYEFFEVAADQRILVTENGY